jgi:hypothetical protein
MARQGIAIRASSRRLLLPVLLGASLVGCHADETDPGAPLGHMQAPLHAADCTEYRDLPHCALGDAVVSASRDGATLGVTSLRTPGRDGVAILLPDSTGFDVFGTRETSSDSTMHWRAISAGAVTSTMTVQNTDNGFTVSGTFTGSDPSTYTAELYRAGELVGAIRGLKSGTGVRARHVQQLRIRIRIRIGFRVVIDIIIGRAEQVSATEGACVWDLPLQDGQEAVTTLPDGTDVTFDRVQLVEEVRGSGSYPYASFDRLDYTSNDESLQITDERQH